MPVIDGKVVAETVLARLQQTVADLRRQHALQPGLAVVLIGEDPASQIYVATKVKKATELGLLSVKHVLPATATQAQVLAVVAQLNQDPRIHGILVQSPPPRHIDERAIIDAVNPAKDVDCFHPYNVGKLLIGDEDGFYPCTPYGCMQLLRHYQLPTAGRHAVIIGRSNIVGKPLAALLGRKGVDCTVTLCHSRTPDLATLARQADILVAALGKPRFVTPAMVKPGAVVLDVGINRIDDPSSPKGYRVVGDVDYDAVAPQAGWITPVPGGVGPMTIAMLLTNAVRAACRLHHLPLPD